MSTHTTAVNPEIYNEWEAGEPVNFRVVRLSPVSFRVERRDNPNEVDQALVELERVGAEAKLVATQGHLSGEDIPTRVYDAIWRAITHAQGIAL